MDLINRWNREQWIKGVLIGLLALAGGALVIAADIKSESDKFKKTSEIVYQEITQRLVTAEGVVTALVNFGDDGELTDSESNAISSGLLKNYPFITSIARLDRVVFSIRKQYENNKNAERDDGYEIREYNPGNEHFITARTRNAYLVMSKLVPMGPRVKPLLGVDLLTDAAVNRAYTRALEKNSVVLTSVPAFFPQTPGLMLLRNTYKDRTVPSSLADRIKLINGAVALMISPQKLFAPIINKHLDIDSDITLPDAAGAGKAYRVFSIQHQDERTLFIPPLVFSQQRTLNVASSALMLEMSSHYHPSLIQLVIATVVMLLIVIALQTWQVYRVHRHDASMQQEKAYRDLFSERERAQVTLSSIGDAVITTDEDGKITYLNPVAEKFIGMSHDAAMGKPIEQVVNLYMENGGGDEDEKHRPVNLLAPDAGSDYESTGVFPSLLDRGNEDNPLSVDISTSSLKDIRGHSIGSVIIMRDVSHELELKKQLTYQASHDPLTGLANRIRFENEVKKAILSSDESSLGHALCYMDLDQFKVVNDTCGHMAGDALLKQLAKVLEKRVRGSDVLARLGGDEFGLLLLDCDLENAVSIADSLRLAVRQFIFRWDERAFDIRISIGVVAIDNPRSTHAELMSAADVACYIAKDSGRDIVHAYQPKDKTVTRHHDLMLWSQKIHDALRNDNFYLMLQTMTSLLSGQEDVQIQEFLLRIRTDDGEVVTPDVFIPAAERYGLMRDIDMWVIDSALRIISDVQKETESTLTYVYSLNLSGQSVGDAEIASFLLAKLDEYGVAASNIMLEITETAAITNFDGALDFIKRLSDAGCRFALDDFGAGLSSFGYLKRMKVDFIKIDGQFVKTMANDSIDRMMVNNITHLAYGLGLYVIAESVEDETTLEMLRNIGVHFAQGYHIQRPTSIHDWKKENHLKNIFIRTLH